jgi:hypothetical protein
MKNIGYYEEAIDNITFYLSDYNINK